MGQRHVELQQATITSGDPSATYYHFSGSDLLHLIKERDYCEAEYRRHQHSPLQISHRSQLLMGIKSTLLEMTKYYSNQLHYISFLCKL
jgi:hypothetical protein